MANEKTKESLDVVVYNKEDLKKLKCHQDINTWMYYKGVKHKVIYSDKEITSTVSKKGGFIIRTHYDSVNFPKIIYQEKQDINKFLESYKEGASEGKERNAWWNLNFYNGTLNL